MTIGAGQMPTAAEFAAAIQRRVARARRETNASATSAATELPILRLDDIPLLGGQSYNIWCPPLNPGNSVGGDTVIFRLRYTEDGSTPTIASTQLAAERWISAGTGSTTEIKMGPKVDYNPAADVTFSILLTVARAGGTGTMTVQGSAVGPICINIDNMGDDPGNTGVPL